MFGSIIIGMLFQPGEAAAPVPAGSYRQTCRNIDVGPYRIRADCGTMSGGHRHTVMRGWRQCQGEIVNRNGHLVCEAPARPGMAYVYDPDALSTARAPGGSYAQTCVNITQSGDMLEASCRTRDGSWRSSMLPRAQHCQGDIANIDGILTCMR